VTEKLPCAAFFVSSFSRGALVKSVLTVVLPSKLVLPETLAALHITTRYNGQNLAVGTAFVARVPNGYVLITNRHNVTGRNNVTGDLMSTTGAIPNELVITHNKGGMVGEWVARIEPLYENEVPRWREHPRLGPKADFVALPLTQTEGISLLEFNLSPDRDDISVGPAEPISVIGYPFGRSAEGFAIWATGFIASELAIDFEGLPIFLIDCRTRPGQSGSPVIAFRAAGAINMRGGVMYSADPAVRFMGIYSGRINDSSDIGMVWKTSAVRELIDTWTPRPNYGQALPK
jgi:hypothetical protein